MNKPLILVVEDDSSVKNLITTTLKAHDYNIDNDLNDQSGVYFSKDKIFFMFYRNAMLYTFTIYMVQCLRNYFIYQICRRTNIQPPFLYPSNGEKIFHKINQPHGIVVNIGV